MLLQFEELYNSEPLRIRLKSKSEHRYAKYKGGMRKLIPAADVFADAGRRLQGASLLAAAGCGPPRDPKLPDFPA